MTTLLVAAVAAGVAWAAASVLTPADDVLGSSAFTFVAVTEGEVGSSIALNTVAEWTPIPVGVNRAAGVVTSVAVAPGDEVNPGSVLYTVDLKPVVVAQGEVPAFRAIGQGTQGPDVAQAQQLLAAVGLYGGPADGKAGAGTVTAIRAWQKQLGLAQTGVIEPGDIIFLPTLPTRVALDAEQVSRGATLSGGEDVLQGLPTSPNFSIPVTDSQAALMPAGTRVEITSPSGAPWLAFAGEQTPDPESGTITVALEGDGGAVICADACGEVPVTGEALLSSRIVTVPAVAGLVVPSAALITVADGTVAVIDEAGTRIPVTVTAAARGMSVVEGVDAGIRVRVPATESQ